MNPLAVIILTSTRTKYAIETIRAANRYLHCAYGVLFYVACDNSNDAHVSQIFPQFVDDTVLGYHVDNLGYGGAVNLAMKNIMGGYPVHLMLEDDWILSQDLDVTPYVELLHNRDDIGMVRLGHMPINLDL